MSTHTRFRCLECTYCWSDSAWQYAYAHVAKSGHEVLDHFLDTKINQSPPIEADPPPEPEVGALRFQCLDCTFICVNLSDVLAHTKINGHQMLDTTNTYMVNPKGKLIPGPGLMEATITSIEESARREQERKEGHA